MDTVLVVMIALIVGSIALGMYMDWFGLWVSKDELENEKKSLAKSRLQDLRRQIGVGVSVTNTKAVEKTAAVVSGTPDLNVSSDNHRGRLLMKRLLGVLLLLVVGIVGMGFYLGWFRLSTDSKDDNTNVTFTVDEDKFHDDKEKAKDKMQDLGHKAKDNVAGPGESKDQVAPPKK